MIQMTTTMAMTLEKTDRKAISGRKWRQRLPTGWKGTMTMTSLRCISMIQMQWKLMKNEKELRGLSVIFGDDG
jgi:hypothetical protein